MGAFPSPLEHSLAAVLLLLSSSSSSPSCNDEPSPDFSSSSSSDLTSDGSSGRIGADPLRILAMAAYYVERKIKIVKRRRSKMHCISDRQRVLSIKQKETEQKHKEVSVLSSSSSSSTVTDGPSCNRVRIGKRSWKCVKVGRRRKAGSAELTRLRFRGEAILELLSSGCASEIRIRATLGDSPDTSKALRMSLEDLTCEHLNTFLQALGPVNALRYYYKHLLLKLKEVKRSGAGGQRDPFCYAVTRPCSKVDSA